MALSLGTTLVSTPASAENWTVTPAVGVSETYTTNSNLGASGQGQGSFVTSATGSVAVNGTGARARLNGTVALQAVVYTGDRSDNTLYPQANLLGSIEAVEKFFYVEAAVNVSQTYLSPFAPQPVGNIGATNNRYTAASFRVSPYIQGVFPGEITYLLRNDNIWTNLSNTPTNVPGSTFNGAYVSTWLGRVASPIRTFGWTVEGNTSYTKFTGEQALTTQIVRGILHYQPDPQLRLDAIGGYEWNDYFVTKSDNVVYGAGLEWRPTDRTTVAGDWQQRFFGSSWLAAFNHRNPYTAFNVNASRNISTYPQQLFALPAGASIAALVDAAFTTRIPDPTQRAAAVQAFLLQTGLPATLQAPLNFYTQQVILYEQESATFTVLGLRNSLAFTVYNRKQEVISGGTGQPLPPPFGSQNNNTQRGGSVAYSHQLTPLTNLNAVATHYDTTATAPFTGKSTTSYFGLSVGTRLGPKTSGTTGLSYTVFDSNLSNDYTAFTAYVGLNHSF